MNDMTDEVGIDRGLYITDAELIRRMGVHRNVSAINFGANLFNAVPPNRPAKFFKAIRRKAVV